MAPAFARYIGIDYSSAQTPEARHCVNSCVVVMMCVVLSRRAGRVSGH